MTLGTSRRTALVISVGLFLVGCLTPALVFHVKQQLGAAGSRWLDYRTLTGASLMVQGLALGWLRLNFTAFANVPLWLSWVMFARGRIEAARLFAILALAISTETLQLAVQPYLWDEGAVDQGYLVAPHIGVLCWLSSMLTMAFMSHRLLTRERQSVRDTGPQQHF